MATPFSQAPPMDPVRGAALQGIRERSGTATAPAGPVGPPQAEVPGGGNQVAQLLAQAARALLEGGPTPENLAAVQQFVDFLKQLSPTAQPTGQEPVGAAPPPVGPPAGGAGPPIPPV